MKLSLALYGLAAVIALPGLGSAGTLQWNFLNDVPTGSTGVAVSSPHSFTDTQNDPTTIMASIVQSSNNSTQLFEKNGGGHETGLGIYGLVDNEIDTGSKVKLDLNNILALNPTSISLALNSVQSGEAGFVEYGNTTDGFNVSDENNHLLNLKTLSADGGYVEVYATSANVLVGGITAVTPRSQVPEPANAAFVAIGLLALVGCVARRKMATSNA